MEPKCSEARSPVSNAEAYHRRAGTEALARTRLLAYPKLCGNAIHAYGVE